jgi:glutamate-1-semialdehyde 2,1-aminomutase
VLNNTTSAIVNGIKVQLAKKNLRHTINQVGSMFTLFFTDTTVIDYHTAKTSDTTLFGKYFNGMLERGIYLAPSQFESLFISHAVDKKIVDRILEASDEVLDELN